MCTSFTVFILTVDVKGLLPAAATPHNDGLEPNKPFLLSVAFAGVFYHSNRKTTKTWKHAVFLFIFRVKVPLYVALITLELTM